MANELMPYFGVKFGFRQGDAVSHMSHTVFSTDLFLKDQLRKDVFLPAADKHFPMLEKLVTQSGSGFILQSGISYVDFCIASYLATMVKPVEGEYLAKYSKLMEYIDRVQGVPQLKEYMSKQ
jgi:hypothetical protein